MKKFFLFPLLLLATLSLPLRGALDFSLNQATEPREIVINNRILLKIKGKSISLMDVVKKMDLIFYRQFPEFASSNAMRYQFYMTNWKTMLASVIDDQLILEDAKEKKIEVTSGDIRESLEKFFGPDVVINLDKVGLTYDEAWKLVETELTVREMVQMMVRSRAQAEVNPKEVRKLYEESIKKEPVQDKWVYQTLNIESEHEDRVSEVAEKASQLLTEQKIPFEDLIASLSNEKDVAIRLSEQYERHEKELSKAHKVVLESLGIGATSAPIIQKTKKENMSVAKLFYLKEKEMGKQIALKEVEEKLTGELMQQAITKYQAAYSKKLRKHYGITEKYLNSMIPAHLEPFALR